MKPTAGTLLIGLIVVLVIAALSMFVVDQRQHALVFRLGEVIAVKKEPGLYFKIPLLDNVRYFDVRILTIDTPEAERFLTSEKKNVLVDLFVKWRITDVRQYYVSVRGEESAAATRLQQTINDGLRAEFGNRTVHEVVSGERDQIMELMRKKANEDAKSIGAEVIDVRLKRVDLVPEISSDVYRRMESERKRVANELRFGTVWVNDHLALATEMPHGGFKQSGYGKDGSKYALEDYQEIKHVMVNHAV